MKNKESISHYLERTKKARRRTGIVFSVAFILCLGFFCVLGLILPLRPERSDLEKRKLADFPVFTAGDVWDGEYFSGLSTWYADTYPAREEMISLNSSLHAIFGIRDTALYGTASGKTADEIPNSSSLSVAPVIRETTVSESVSGSSAAAQEKKANESVNPVTAATSSTDQGAAPQSSSISGTSASSEDQAATAASGTTEAEADTETPKADGTIHQIPEAVGTVYITGDRGFDIYYFSQGGADAYASMINTVQSRLSGYGLSTYLYDMVIPTSFGVCLDDNVQQALGGSLQKDAIPYIYARIDSSVKKVSIFDQLLDHNTEYLYFRTDHHWTALGAYYAYRQFCAEKGIRPHELSDYQETDFPGFLGTYYSMSNQSQALAANPDTVQAWIPIGTNTMTMTEADGTTMEYPIISDASVNSSENKYLAFIAGDQPYEEIHNPGVTDGSTAVLIKESFGNCFAPFLVDHYQNLYIIDYRYYDGDLTQFCKDHGVTDLIFANNTEAITEERAETMLNLFPAHS